MVGRNNLRFLILAGFILFAGTLTAASAAPPVDQAALDKAFAALKTYDWGHDREALRAIDQAVASSHDNPTAQRKLEARLADVLKSDVPRAAKDFVCRKLSLIGSIDSVPTVATLLVDEKLSHMARYALERMPCPEANKALRDALPKTSGLLKVGIINSLGVRRDRQCVPALVGLLEDSDQQVVAAAAAALGAVGTSEAAAALAKFQGRAPKALALTVADARLTCAEHLLAGGKKAEAIAIYKDLSKPDQPKHVRLAATRGLLAAARSK